jgi:hypothetical protein
VSPQACRGHEIDVRGAQPLMLIVTESSWLASGDCEGGAVDGSVAKIMLVFVRCTSQSTMVQADDGAWCSLVGRPANQEREHMSIASRGLRISSCT